MVAASGDVRHHVGVAGRLGSSAVRQVRRRAGAAVLGSRRPARAPDRRLRAGRRPRLRHRRADRAPSPSGSASTRWSASTRPTRCSPGRASSSVRPTIACASRAATSASGPARGDHDLVLANASLQWVPDHAEVLARWWAALAPGGQLAVQVPANADHPSHRVADEVGADRAVPVGDGRDAARRPGRRQRARPGAVRDLLDHLGAVAPARAAAGVPAPPRRRRRRRRVGEGHDADPVRQACSPTSCTSRSSTPTAQRLLDAIGDSAPYFYPFKRILIWATPWPERRDEAPLSDRRWNSLPAMARFGRVVTAMVTPFDDDGSPRRRRRRRAGPLAAGAGQRGARRRRHDRRGADAHRRREADAVGGRRRGGDDPGHRRVDRRNDTAHSVHLTAEASKRRRRRDPGAVPVLQPAVAGRHRGPPARRRRGHRPAGHHLRHPRPHRPQDLHRRCSSAWPTRSPTSSASRTPPATRPRRRGSSPPRRTASRSTAATTR